MMAFCVCKYISPGLKLEIVYSAKNDFMYMHLERIVLEMLVCDKKICVNICIQSYIDKMYVHVYDNVYISVYM